MNPFTKNPELPVYITPIVGDSFIRRKHDIHLGYDIYLPKGEEVIIPVDLSKISNVSPSWEVVRIENFTGPNSVPPTPWWNHTQSVILKNNEKVLIYGEIETHLKVGDKVACGEVVGKVVPVLKKDTGLPASMLHVECWHASLWGWLNSLSAWLKKTRVRNLISLIPYSSFVLSEVQHSQRSLQVVGESPFGETKIDLPSSVGLEKFNYFSETRHISFLARKHEDTYLHDEGASKRLRPGEAYVVTREVDRVEAYKYSYSGIEMKNAPCGFEKDEIYIYLGSEIEPAKTGYRNGRMNLFFLHEKNGIFQELKVYGSYRISKIFQEFK